MGTLLVEGVGVGGLWNKYLRLQRYLVFFTNQTNAFVVEWEWLGIGWSRIVVGWLEGRRNST